MKHNTVKIILDTIMAAVFVLMYKKGVLGLTFHEAGGLFVCALVIVHTLLNRQWITSVTKNIFSGQMPAKTRACSIVDFLLALMFLAILITGIGVSKKLLPSLAFLGFKGNPYHFFFAAIALLLIGVHLGLHWNWIAGTITNHKKVPAALKGVLIAVLTVSLCFGGYSLVTSSMGMWLTAPFNTEQMAAAHGAGGYNGGAASSAQNGALSGRNGPAAPADMSAPSGNPPAPSAGAQSEYGAPAGQPPAGDMNGNPPAPSAGAQSGHGAPAGQPPAGDMNGNPPAPPAGAQSGHGAPAGQPPAEMNGANPQMPGGHPQEPVTVAGVLLQFARFACMLILVAFITVIITALCERGRKKPAAAY